MLHGFFDNGDGLMLMPPQTETVENVHCWRLLYTDSGRYLLPTDDPDPQKCEEPELAEVCADALALII